MKIMTVLGTRPEIIRLSRVIPKLDKISEQILLNTNQNFDPRLNELFFKELRVRPADISLDCRSDTPMGQVSNILKGVEKELIEHKPDKLLILGDTNSGLAAMVAKRLGVNVYHMEAGNRCFDDRVPEEVNRRVIDHSSDILMPYTERSRYNLLNEGIPSERIFTTGNPILEVLDYFQSDIEKSNILSTLDLNGDDFFLVTLHRAENVDDPERLKGYVVALNALVHDYNVRVVWSVHPRTRQKLRSLDLKVEEKVLLCDPFGLFDFVKLEKNAICVLTDSGTVQEECCIFGIPNVTLRDVTERPETIESGSNVLSGGSPDIIASCVRRAMEPHVQWEVPPEYLRSNVSDIVTNILMGYRR